jgi:hypothetical protein
MKNLVGASRGIGESILQTKSNTWRIQTQSALAFN